MFLKIFITFTIYSTDLYSYMHKINYLIFQNLCEYEIEYGIYFPSLNYPR